jgi:hypothetical protein
VADLGRDAGGGGMQRKTDFSGQMHSQKLRDGRAADVAGANK